MTWTSDPLRRRGNHDIAIVGIGCRYPGGATDPDSFWHLLSDGHDAVREVTPDRWSIDKYYSPRPGTPGRTYAKWAGLLDEIDRFEPECFGISPREAHYIDPQQRLLLEASFEALEDAGQPLDHVSGSRTGVYVGISTSDYAQIQNTSEQRIANTHSATGGAFSIAANRISYCFNLRGPSVAIDTACSSSLVATDLACRALADGQIDLALAGGVNVIIISAPFIAFCAANMLSPDGRCKSFDASANGFVRGEGVGVVALKRLDRAIDDGDSIYAVIVGSGTNQDARTNGITLPSRDSQEALVREVCEGAGIAPADVDYVEAHGTGTAVGDPTEAYALGTVLSQGRDGDSPCLVGSVKSNIGHLEAGAGLAGLIKTALVLKHRRVPPNLHYREPNPNIPFEDLKLRVVDEFCDIAPGNKAALIAGVNSFGFGGTNAHVLLREHLPPPREAGAPLQSESAKDGRATRLLLPLSARSPDALQRLAREYIGFIGKDESRQRLADICFTAATRRTHFDHRLAIVAEDGGEAIEGLEAFVDGERRPGVVTGHRLHDRDVSPVFVFSGQGPQWWGMGRGLLETNRIFRDKVERIDAEIRRHGDWSLLEELGRDESDSRMNDTTYAQPALFALQVGLVDVLKSWGVEPAVVVGHSVGEVAAAHVCGALDLEQAVRVIFHRGRCMGAAPGGRMLALGLEFEEAQSLAAPFADRISVAAHNSPQSVTLSGEGEALEEIAARFEGTSTFCRFLPVQYAFHSPQMEPIRDELASALDGLETGVNRLPAISTVTGEPAGADEFGAEYWWHNVRERVRFADAIALLAEEGRAVFVEVSPHPVLATSITQCLARHSQTPVIVPSLRRDVEDDIQVKAAVGMLFAAGSALDWSTQATPGSAPVRLPAHPWLRERYWHEPRSSYMQRAAPPVHPLLEERSFTAEPSWHTLVSSRHFPYLGDHVVQGKLIFPAAAYVEMALAAGAELRRGEATVTVIEELQFNKAMFLSPETDGLAVQLEVSERDGSFTVSSGEAEVEGGDWQTNCGGYLRSAPQPPAEIRLDAAGAAVDVDETVDRDTCYRRFADVGLEYGATFRGVRRIRRIGPRVLGEVRIDEPLERESSYRFHPALLDSCFQVVSGLIPRDDAAERLYLPVRIDRVTAYADRAGRVGEIFQVQAEPRSADPKAIFCDLLIADDEGRVLMKIEGFTCESVAARGSADSRRARDSIYEFQWIPKPRPGQPRRAGHPAEVFDRLEREQHVLREETKRISAPWTNHSTDVIESLDRLATAYLFRALLDLGVSLTAESRLDLSNLAESGPVASRHRRLLRSLFGRMAESDDWLEVGGSEQWLIKESPPIESPEQLYREILAEHPGFFSELSLVSRCGERLAGILRGEVDPLEVLFAYDGGTAAEHFYQDSPTFRYENAFVARCAAYAAASAHRGESLRVLEIGAGTGGMTSYVLGALEPGRAQYVYTDVSSQFFEKAGQKFRDYPFVEYQTLDIEKTPAEQGFTPGAFDLVLASYVFHATRDLADSLAHARELLAPGGMLMFLETERPHLWVDTIFGLTDGWWRFEDREIRPDHPLLGREGWKGVLATAGFEAIEARSVTTDDQVADQIVIQARAPREPASAPAVESTKPEMAARWLLFADAHGVGEALCEHLAAAGNDVSVATAGPQFASLGENRYALAPDDAEQMTRLVEAMKQSGPLAGIVYLWGLDAPGGDDELTLSSLKDAESVSCYALMHLMHSLADQELDRSLELLVVTRRAFALPGIDGPIAVAQAPLIGMARLIGSEHTQMKCRLVDLDDEGPEAAARELSEEITDPDAEEEAALRDGARFAPRFDRRRAEHERIRIGAQEDASAARFRLMPGDAGSIDTLTARETGQQTPEPGQVEIEVHAASLNFRDVLKTLNLYPSDGGDSMYLGDECAGRVTAVGPGVDRFRVGDAVMAVAPGCFSSHVLTREQTVVHIPPRMEFEDAATIPITFLTAHYALHSLARIRAGESVLIQAAAGGVGLSALQVAREAGARVLATAGTPEKRDLLRRLGIEHVMDSRSTAFAEEVMNITGGRGVDVVLNSLAGEAIPKGISCLAPYGRFLELGKRDIYQNSKLGLWAFRRNLSFFGIDLSRLVAERPEEVRDLLETISGRVASGAYHPLPQRLFSIGRARDAFRYMAQARHIGKVVLGVMENEIEIESARPPATRMRSDGTYLVTGGLGGFGLTLANWLVANGARSVVLASRSGSAPPEASETLAALADAGARVEVKRMDVSDGESVRRVVDEIDASLPPLAGVFHAAMVLDDGLLRQLDAERFRKVMAPKVDGCWNLHEVTRARALDCFVLFSSVSSVVGNAGQANYVAANSFLDAFAGYRRAMGLPALTVNWGRIDEVGYVARNEEVARSLDRRGFLGLAPEKALEALGQLLAAGAANASVVRMDWHKTNFAGQRFTPVTEGAEDADSGSDERGHARTTILEAPTDKQPALVFEFMLKQISRVLGVSSAKLDPTAPLNEMGLDSLMAVELENKIENDLDVSLPTSELMESPTVQKLTLLAIEQLGIEHGELAFEHSPQAPDSVGDPVVVLRDGGDGRPLVCMHASDGTVDIYRDFVRAMPSGVPILGINSVLGAHDDAPRDIEAMAAHYADLIRGRTEPPYRLFGFSFGGLMALQVAEVLERHGPLEFLGLVDFRPEWVDPVRARRDLTRDMILGLYEFLAAENDVIDDRGDAVSRESVTRLSEKLNSVDGERRVRMIVDWVEDSRILPENVPTTLIEAYIRRYEAHLGLIAGSRLPVLDVPVYYWRATRGLEQGEAADYSWQPYTKCVAEGSAIACGHWEIMTPPNVDAVASRVFDVLTGHGEETRKLHSRAV